MHSTHISASNECERGAPWGGAPHKLGLERRELRVDRLALPPLLLEQRHHLLLLRLGLLRLRLHLLQLLHVQCTTAAAATAALPAL